MALVRFFAPLSPSSLVSGSELKISFFALALNLLKRVIILAERSFLQLVPRSADVSSLCVMRFFMPSCKTLTLKFSRVFS